VSGHVVFVY